MDHPAAGANKPAQFFKYAALVLALLFGIAALWGLDTGALGLFHDDGIYTVVAKSLAERDGYRIVSLPGAPAQTKYPFGYSYILSWFWTIHPIFPDNIVLLKGVNSAILGAIFLVAASYYRRTVAGSSVAGLLFATLVCSNPIIFGFTDYVLSDLWLVLLTLLALTLSSGIDAERAKDSRLLLLAGVIGLAILTRMAALPLAVAGAVHAYVERGWRAAAVFLAAVSMLIAPWFAWQWAHAEPMTQPLFAYYSGYGAGDLAGATLTASFERRWPIIHGNAYYLIDMMQLFYLTPLLPGSGFIVGLFSVIGVLSTLGRKMVFAWTFLLMSIGLLLLWPFHPGRYLAPLAPLILLIFFCGMSRAQSWLSARWLSRLAWTPVLISFMLNGVWISGYLLVKDDLTTRGLFGRRLPYSWNGFKESFAWLREHTEPESLLATAYDPMYYLYTGRRAIRPALHRPATYFYPLGAAQPDVGTADEIKPQMARLGVNYLIIDPLDGYAEGKATLKLFDDLVVAFGSRAEKVFTSADGKHRIYRLTYP